MEKRGTVLIDGWNVVHAWPHLCVLTPAVAAERLRREVAVLADGGRDTVYLVFDGRGERAQVEAPPGGAGLAVVYAPQGMTADGWIEHWLGSSAEPEQATVASADRALCQTAHSYGAHTLAPVDLLGSVREAERRQTASLQRRQARSATAWPGGLAEALEAASPEPDPAP